MVEFRYLGQARSRESAESVEEDAVNGHAGPDGRTVRSGGGRCHSSGITKSIPSKLDQADCGDRRKHEEQLEKEQGLVVMLAMNEVKEVRCHTENDGCYGAWDEHGIVHVRQEDGAQVMASSAILQ